MPTLAIKVDPTAVDVQTDDAVLRVTLADGRELAVAALEWLPRLRDATTEQRRHWAAHRARPGYPLARCR